VTKPTTKGKQLMTSIDMETLLTIVFVRIDDWYQAKGQQWMKSKVGRKPEFSDSEVMTVMVAMTVMVETEVMVVMTAVATMAPEMVGIRVTAARVTGPAAVLAAPAAAPVALLAVFQAVDGGSKLDSGRAMALAPFGPPCGFLKNSL
jgi:hypothetical protein